MASKPPIILQLLVFTNEPQTLKLLVIFLVPKKRNATCITILNTFNIPDDKKGVDRASTVIARETIEGTDAARLCGVIQYRPTALLEPRV